MSKERQKDGAVKTMLFGILVAGGGLTLNGNVFQIPMLLGGIAIFGFGAYTFAIASGMIQTGKVVKPKGTETTANQNDALDALKLRFAKGEITTDQYEQMKKELSE